jgi:hypothetical protein
MNLNILIIVLLAIAITLLFVDKIQIIRGRKIPVDKVKCFGCDWEGRLYNLAINDNKVPCCPECGSESELHYLMIEVEGKQKER